MSLRTRTAAIRRILSAPAPACEVDAQLRREAVEGHLRRIEAYAEREASKAATVEVQP